jgi:hypothetical protein
MNAQDILSKMQEIIGNDEDNDKVGQFCLMSIMSSDFGIILLPSQISQIFNLLTIDQLVLINEKLDTNRKWY